MRQNKKTCFITVACSILTLFCTSLINTAAETGEEYQTIQLNRFWKSKVGERTISSDGSCIAFIERGIHIDPQTESFEVGCQSVQDPIKLAISGHPNYERKLIVVNTATLNTKECKIRGSPGALALSPNGKLLAVGSNSKTTKPEKRGIRLFDTATAKRTANLIVPVVTTENVYCSAYCGGGNSLTFSENSRILLATDSCRTLKSIIDVELETQKPRMRYSAHAKLPIGLCAFSSHDDQLYAAQFGNTVKLFDLRQKPVYATVEIPGQATDRSLGFSSDGSTLYVSSRNPKKNGPNLINLIALATRRLYKSFEDPSFEDRKEPTAQTPDGVPFEVVMPALKANRTFTRMNPSRLSRCDSCCTSNDERTLLSLQSNYLYLTTPTPVATESSSVSN